MIKLIILYINFTLKLYSFHCSYNFQYQSSNLYFYILDNFCEYCLVLLYSLSAYLNDIDGFCLVILFNNFTFYIWIYYIYFLLIVIFIDFILYSDFWDFLLLDFFFLCAFAIFSNKYLFYLSIYKYLVYNILFFLGFY